MRKHLFIMSGLPFWHQESIKSSCFSKTHFLYIILLTLFGFVQERLTLGTPSKSRSIFFFVLPSPILAVELLKYKRFLYCLRLRQIHGETPSGSTLWNPVGAKMAQKIDQVAPKCFKKTAPETCSWKRIDSFMHFGRPLAHFWCSFDTLLVPIGSLLQDFQWFFDARFCQYLAKKWVPPKLPASEGVGGRPDVTMGSQTGQVASKPSFFILPTTGKKVGPRFHCQSFLSSSPFLSSLSLSRSLSLALSPWTNAFSS